MNIGKLNRNSTVAYVTSAGMATLVAAFLVCSVVAPTERANADTMAYKDATTGYVTSVQSADNLTLEMTTLPKANLAKISDTVVTKTNNPNGYQLYFSMDRVSDYASNRPGNALYMDNNPTSSNFIPSTTNTFAAPGDLAANTWGFSLDNGASFSAVPLRNSAVKVAENTSATSAAGDSLAVTYGVSANNALPDGTYSGRIVYNVVSETSATDIDRMMLSPSEVEPGDTLTIRTSLYTTHTFATTDVSVKIATSESGTASTGNACEVTSVSTADGMLSLECTVPDFDLDVDTYNLPIEVTIASYGKTYSGIITVNVTTPPFSCVANQICYNPNGADVVGTMENQTTVYLNTTSSSVDYTPLSGSTTEFTLYSPNYSRTGYGFAGWNTKADGTGTMFVPNQTLTTSDSTLTSAMQSDLGSKGLIFHAIWVPSAGDLQTWTDCGNLTQGSVTALTDSRDSQTYAVAKLVDDKCWTIENMRYKPTAGTETTSFSTTNPGSQQYSLTNIDRTKDPLAVSSQGSPYYQWYSYGGQYSWLSSINTTTNNSSQYYNYNTSSSGYTTTGTTMAARTATDAVKNANICPAGWRLPRVAYNGYIDARAGSNSDFPYLQNALNSQYTYTSTFASSNNWRKYPNNFVFAGYWYGANANNRGANGSYWSSSVSGSNNAYYLYFRSTDVNPANGNSKRYGYSVRCVYSS
ncbi:hypothetical protein IKF40_01130 [Candidatus Saccharibacteria bacterium]|nr:hypothetical protein [Candidatus Saccharibacteria bacterium]